MVAMSTSALTANTPMYQTTLIMPIRLARSENPVSSTRAAMRPAKSFWKKPRLWRTTCQWLCQRIRPVKPGMIAWCCTSPCRSAISGRPTRRSAAMPSRPGAAASRNSSGRTVATASTMRPMKIGIAASTSASASPSTSSAAYNHFTWRTKNQ